MPLYSVDGIQDKLWISGRTLFKADDAVGSPHGLIEYIVSEALDFCTVSGAPINHVSYTTIKLGDRVGCICDNYLNSNEYEQCFWDIPITSSFMALTSSIELEFLFDDLAATFLCDALFYNTDRHQGNLVVLCSKNSKRLAPVFDMGSSLTFVDEPCYDKYVPVPYGVDQLFWASDRMRPTFNLTGFYNSFDRNVPGYSKSLVDEYLERVVLCADTEFIRMFWEVQ